MLPVDKAEGQLEAWQPWSRSADSLVLLAARPPLAVSLFPNIHSPKISCIPISTSVLFLPLQRCSKKGGERDVSQQRSWEVLLKGFLNNGKKSQRSLFSPLLFNKFLRAMNSGIGCALMSQIRAA